MSVTTTRPATYAALAVLLLVALCAVFPSVLGTHDPLHGSAQALQAPSAEHWFGTDAVGRDVYTRVVWGARSSVLGAAIAVGLGASVGTALGALAGIRRGWVEHLIMRAVDVLLAVPALLLSLAIIIVLGFGTVHAAIAVGVGSIATFTRLARAQVLAVAQSDYVTAAYGAGASRAAVLIQHVLPNAAGPIVALIPVQCGSAVLQLATLGFLGYGAPPPQPEWGLIIADSRDYIATAWWLTALPGIVIVAVVLAAHHLSHALRREG